MARHGLGLIDIQSAFGREEQCSACLEVVRWPEGIRCFKCKSDRVSKFMTNPTTHEVKTAGAKSTKSP